MTKPAFQFPLRRGTLHREHGYELLCGLSGTFPFLHGRPDIQIAPVRGRRLSTNGTHWDRLAMDHKSILHIRGLRPEEAAVIQEKGRFRINDQLFQVGPAQIKPLLPSDHLVARAVIFRDVFTPEGCEAVLQERIGGDCQIDVGRARGVPVCGHFLKGFTVRLNGLSPETSVSIQAQGLGLKTSMGCGVFYPGTLR